MTKKVLTKEALQKNGSSWSAREYLTQTTRSSCSPAKGPHTTQILIRLCMKRKKWLSFLGLSAELLEKLYVKGNCLTVIS